LRPRKPRIRASCLPFSRFCKIDRNVSGFAMSEILARNKRAVSLGYWLAVAAGIALAAAYFAGACTFGALCD
jgi:hypothetical protein